MSTMKSEKKSTYPFLESVGVYDGRAPLLPYHQARVDRTFAAFYPGQQPIDLRRLLEKTSFPPGKRKWRVSYNHEAVKAEIAPFPKRDISCLQIMEVEDLDYAYKFTERDKLDALYQRKAQSADEILILRNGFLTDAYYYNVVVKIGSKFLTPRQPLLKGVMRAFYLENQKIQEADLTKEDLFSAEGVYLINALHSLEEAPFVRRERIIWEN